MSETLGDRILYAAADWEAVRADNGIEAGRDEFNALRALAARADAAEALALATAARVEAETRERMAWHFRVKWCGRHDNLDRYNPGKDAAFWRFSRAADRYITARRGAEVARQAECIALAAWKAVKHG